MDLRVLLHKAARKVGGLVGRDAPCDADQDRFTFEHSSFPFIEGRSPQEGHTFQQFLS